MYRIIPFQIEVMIDAAQFVCKCQIEQCIMVHDPLVISHVALGHVPG